MKFTPIFLLFLIACIGTDHLDDPKDSAILIETQSLSLIVGQTDQIVATYYYNMWVVEEEAELLYSSSNPNVATVNQTGTVTAISKGQADVAVWYPGEDTTSVQINVVEGSNDVAEVILSAPKNSISIGETMLLSAIPYTLQGSEFTQEYSITWTSSNTQVATIGSTGLLTGVAQGAVQITAQINDVESVPLTLMVGVSARVGTFQGNGSYQAVGTATLVADVSGQLTLTFSNDFETSFALGTFVYLANSTSGTVVRSQGLEIAEVTSNGAKTYNISQVDASVELDDYRFVILLCKPASITFGSAELN